jgi:hypothetical protein
MLLYSQKIQRISFKVTFTANGQVSALITPSMEGNKYLPALTLIYPTDNISRSYILKVTCPALRKGYKKFPQCSSEIGELTEHYHSNVD